MSFDLRFDKLALYDSGEPGISIRVEIRLGSESVTINAKVDTGSAICIFERRLGDSLGIDIESGDPQRVNTVTGTFLVYRHDVTLLTEGFEFDSPVHFAADKSFKRNVLGRHGWLDRVVIGINDYDGKLYLSRYE
jgi:hypothetical protein